MENEDGKRLEIFQAAVAQMTLHPFGIHGPIHWYNVYTNTKMLHPNAPADWDWFYWCFAMLHDCCRKHDMADPGHGLEAARLIDQHHKSDFNTRMNRAISQHTTGQTTDDPLIGVCWDADRIDLLRVNIVPDPRFMSTARGKQWAEELNAPPAEDVALPGKLTVRGTGQSKIIRVNGGLIVPKR